MGEKDAYQRYMKFKDVDTGEASASQRREFLRSLLPLEQGLVYGDSIGEVPDYGFKFTVSDPTPIRDKPMPYKKEERQWIREYISNQVELGLLEEVRPGDPDPTFIVNCVLVREG